MYKRKIWRYTAIITAFLCFFVVCGSITLAENHGELPYDVAEEDQALIPTDENNMEGDESGEIVPLNITFGDPNYYTLQTSATVYYAPYGTGCASTGYTLSAGTGVYLIGRDYDCFYVYWYINGKEMYGYIPMSALNPTSYIWTQYDIYRPGTCTATTPVLSFAGTTSTYIKVGEIYANEYPLLILGQIVNQWNNHTYYFVQYLTSAGLAKRGWVDANNNTVTCNARVILSNLKCSNSFYIRNKKTGKVLTWNSTYNTLEQEEMIGGYYQEFKLIPTKYSYNSETGYFQIALSANPNKVIQIPGTGFAEGLRSYLEVKSTMDKRQEFRFQYVDISTDNGPRRYTTIASRCTGEYRALEASTSDLSVNQKVINKNKDEQLWELIMVSAVWDGTYGLNSGAAHPGNYKVYVDNSVPSEFSISDIQSCMDKWNQQDSRFSIQVLRGSGTTTNCLATISKKTLNDSTSSSSSTTFAASDDETYTIGMMCPMINVGGVLKIKTNPSSADLNGNWQSTKIYIDFNKIREKSGNNYRNIVLQTIVHELGHSLKLSHSFMRMNMSNNWVETDFNTGSSDDNITCMSPTVNTGSDYSIVWIDIRRFRAKWENVS